MYICKSILDIHVCKTRKIKWETKRKVFFLSPKNTSICLNNELHEWMVYWKKVLLSFSVPVLLFQFVQKCTCYKCYMYWIASLTKNPKLYFLLFSLQDLLCTLKNYIFTGMYKFINYKLCAKNVQGKHGLAPGNLSQLIQSCYKRIFFEDFELMYRY